MSDLNKSYFELKDQALVSLNNTVAALKSQVEQLNAQCGDQAKLIEEMKIKITNYEAEKQRNTTLEQQLQQAKEKMKGLENELKICADLKKDHDALRKSYDELKQVNESSENQRRVILNERDHYYSQLQQTQNQINSLQSLKVKSKELHEQFNLCKAELADLKQSVEFSHCKQSSRKAEDGRSYLDVKITWDPRIHDMSIIKEFQQANNSVMVQGLGRRDDNISIIFKQVIKLEKPVKEESTSYIQDNQLVIAFRLT